VRSGKKKHFYCRPRATVSIATPLEWIMRWDITSLVQSVNLILTKKSVTPIGLNILFFALIGEPRAKFWTEWASMYRWNKLQFCFSNFKAVFSFFKSPNLTPLNSKYFEDSKSISGRARRKELGNVQVTLQKMAKLS